MASSLVGSTGGSSATRTAMCGCGVCGLSHFSRALHIKLQTMPAKKTESTTSWRKYKEPRTNQPTKVHIQTFLTRDFSTLTREICHGSSRTDPHEARTSRVTRFVWRVGSDRVSRLSSIAGRVGSGGFKISRVGSGQVGPGQDVSNISRVESGQDPTRTRPDPTREV